MDYNLKLTTPSTFSIMTVNFCHHREKMYELIMKFSMIYFYGTPSNAFLFRWHDDKMMKFQREKSGS